MKEILRMREEAARPASAMCHCRASGQSLRTGHENFSIQKV